jgi:chromate transport protein ChrA
VAQGLNPLAGAVVGFFGIYFPGIAMKHAFLPAWEKLRLNTYVMSGFKGVECAAIGLVFTAVFRLFKIAIIDAENQSGSSVDNKPWFFFIASMAFSYCTWFNGWPVVAIMGGGLLGVLYYGAVRSI